MSETSLDFDPGMARLDNDAWTARLEELAEDLGAFAPLGETHMAAFLDAGPQLLVTFEQAETIRKSAPEAAPRGFAFARREGWSVLSIISQGESWFRDPAIYRYFDRMTDDGFFEDFETVLFHGAHAGGYAAAAYSVAAPGARVLALRPQATLDPRITGFDTRHVAQRRQDFTSRYGYAPDMIDALDKAYILFDPTQRFDAMHAALFRRPNVMHLRCPGFGWRLDAMCDAMGIHDDLIRAAMDGSLDTLTFARLLRARRENTAYLRALYNRAAQAGHHVLAADVCAFVIRQREDGFFADKLTDLAAQGYRPSRPLASAAE